MRKKITKPEDLINFDRFISALPSQRDRMLRDARRTFNAMKNPQPDGGYPGCDSCTCPQGYCDQNAAIVRAAAAIGAVAPIDVAKGA